MSKLESGLKEWVSHGIISAEQAKQIQAHESAKPESSWILSGFFILGVVVIGIGVISLIAANWRQIPDGVKLGADFVLLLSVGFATVRSWESRKAIQFEVLLLFFLLLCLATIGLISQVFHTGGKIYQALLLWSLITFAPALAARQIFVPLVWTGAFLTGVVWSSLDAVTLQAIFRKNSHAVFMAVPLLCACLTITSKNLIGEIATTRAFRSWTLISGLVALFLAELQVFRGNSDDGLIEYLPGYVFALIVALGIWLSLEYKNMQKVLLLTTLGIFLIPFHFPIFAGKSSLANATTSILVLGCMAVFLASLKARRLFQWFLFLLGLRFLVLYFQALGGLATTGVGLIVSGGMVIAMAIFWNKYRAALAEKAERWVQ